MSFFSNVMKAFKMPQEDAAQDDGNYFDDEEGQFYDDPQDGSSYGGGGGSGRGGDGFGGFFGGGRKNQPEDTEPYMEVTMIKPKSMEDSSEICDYLLEGTAVVLNMEQLDLELAQRIIDFTSGASYALNGNLQKISNFIFIATPQNVELSGDFQNMLSSGNADLNVRG